MHADMHEGQVAAHRPEPSILRTADDGACKGVQQHDRLHSIRSEVSRQVPLDGMRMVDFGCHLLLSVVMHDTRRVLYLQIHLTLHLQPDQVPIYFTLSNSCIVACFIKIHPGDSLCFDRQPACHVFRCGQLCVQS